MNTALVRMAALRMLTVHTLTHAADILVVPGGISLAAAIADASPGDTLVLSEGMYSGSTSVGKSLTIRAVSRTTSALLTGPMIVAGSNIKVTIQGLKFAAQLNLGAASTIRVLENHWISGGITASGGSSSQAADSLFVIGNRLDVGDIQIINSGEAYIAGNTLFAGYIGQVGRSAWIVGNSILGPRSIGIAVSKLSSAVYPVSVKIIGNRIVCNDTVGGGSGACVEVRGDSSQNRVYSLVSNNTVQSGRNNRTILLNFATAELRNNIFRCFDNAAGQSILRLAGSTRVNATGNIFIRTLDCPLQEFTDTDNVVSEFLNNMCVQSVSAPQCLLPGGGTENLVADPQFENTNEYRLATTSPAINAGPSEFVYADIDRTRNDIGVYGGPWNIDQFDAQRDPQNLSPFVYPIFSGGAHIGGGQMQLQAIGVSKLR